MKNYCSKEQALLLPIQDCFSIEQMRLWVRDKACRNYALIDLARHVHESGDVMGTVPYFKHRWQWSSDEMQGFLKCLKKQGRIRVIEADGGFTEDRIEIVNFDKFLMRR